MPYFAVELSKIAILLDVLWIHLKLSGAVMRAELQQALTDMAHGRQQRAETMMRACLAREPGFVAGMEVLAMALAQQGAASEARIWFERAAHLQPQISAAWMNLGNVCLECEDADAAAVAFQHARALGTHDVAWLLGYGLALLGKACFVEAHRHLEAAFLLEPGAVDVRLAYAQSLAELEYFDALSACLDGLTEPPCITTQRRALAWLLAQAGKDREAVRLYAQLLSEFPHEVELRAQYALLLERLNRVEDAAEVLDGMMADNAGKAAGLVALAAARVARRQRRPAEAIARVQRGLQSLQPAAMLAQLQFELARSYDLLGNQDSVMTALEQAHLAAGRAFGQRSKTEASGVLAWLDQRLVRPLSAPPAKACDRVDMPEDPVFLVGFPRSGTTLLERMLDAHPQLAALDERPALEAVIDRLRSAPGWRGDDLDASLASMGMAEVVAAKRHYWDEVGRYVVVEGRLVDKYPLTMTRLPYVAQLFPAAHWLLLLRHPCDCVLSCYMQAFGSNGGALAFGSLESTARTYATIMAWWQEQSAQVSANVHILRYEDLVSDPDRELSEVMSFLSLSMEQQQRSFDEQARRREVRINTPSYAQVAQPLNCNAVGRWRSYRKYFTQDVLDVLAPWVHRYGYTLD
ncbi:MAG: sulfotransferase [Stenotrophomonas sp.]